MRLLSATVRNYRVHQHAKVEFDRERTLLGGPNEAGKSTLIEAIHRALFLKSRVTGEVQRSMQSTSSSGHPEVEVVFEAGGRQYQLAKRFSGTSGTTQLVEVGGVPLSGEDAEARLASILGVEETGGGRGAGERASRQWSHLWIWQGESGDDPTSHATLQQAGLLKRLQEQGGAVAMQSALDARVAAHFSDAEAATFAGSRARAGSALDQAEKGAQQASTALAAAQGRCDRLAQTMRDFDEATAELEQAEADRAALSQEADQVAADLNRVAELRRDEENRGREVTEAAKETSRLEATEGQVADLRRQLLDVARRLGPQEADLTRLNDASAERKRQAMEAARARDEAAEHARGCRHARQFSAACLAWFDKAARLDDLERRAERVAKARAEAVQLREELARLPDVSKRDAARLQDLDNQARDAQTALDAMAAHLQVTTAGRPVMVGGLPLATGEARILLDETTVAVGDDVTLVLRPGGGTSLGEARSRAAEASRALAEALASFGLASAAAAAEARMKRSELELGIREREQKLKDEDADLLPGTLREAREARAAAEAEVERRAALVPAQARPATPAEAGTRDKEEMQRLEAAEHAEQRTRRDGELAARKRDEAEESLARASAAVAGQRDTQAALTAQLGLLLAHHGEDPSRQERLRLAREAKDRAQASLGETQRAIAALQPDNLGRNRARLERALALNGESSKRAGERLAVAKSELTLDGTEDPEERLKQARATHEAAQFHLEGVRRQSRAVQRLNQLFRDEQRKLADHFTQPLAAAIAGYLECVFGAGVTAGLELRENSFQGLRVTRPGLELGQTPFEVLSGGAREQVAAAMRLAMAEVLAADHGGCLPVVFDDAFAYSDPRRVRGVQDMLDLAATRGLQVIVATCNPSDYSSLGARVETLRATAPSDAGTTPATSLHPPLETSATDTPSAPAAAGEDRARPAATAGQVSCFLAALEGAGGKAGNQALRQLLGWDESTYQAVREELVEAGTVLPGRGRGGTVTLAGHASSG